jgi:hypothetical protein
VTAECPDRPAAYDPERVARAVLEEILKLHPERLTVGEWSLRIASDPEDDLEVETIEHAIRDLRGWGLVRYRNDDEVVEPTHATLRAAAMLLPP